ncbi:hypothetical protein B4096_2834 [Heyndrickxia coagulans]|uniref:Uncharacterized protein n=1 Tax=Heyndrickxia coagulans TaxID=1398 RepID=A0AAN0T5J5_HEYCO|nr:hypothetical protein SB48_HM08orf02566 [Heyndrickxia coagulans]KYC91879.1 hypothetical protein B4096_2834 [Heyndrickxia coagulans]
MGKKDFPPFCRMIRTRGNGKSKRVCGPKPAGTARTEAYSCVPGRKTPSESHFGCVVIY